MSSYYQSSAFEPGAAAPSHSVYAEVLVEKLKQLFEKSKQLSKTDGKTPEGKEPDGKTPDGKEPDGKTPDGNEPDGKTPDGKEPDGKTPDSVRAMLDSISMGYCFCVVIQTNSYNMHIMSIGVIEGRKKHFKATMAWQTPQTTWHGPENDLSLADGICSDDEKAERQRRGTTASLV